MSKEANCSSPFTGDHHVQALSHKIAIQGGEPEFCASTLQSWDDFADVVADEAEPCIPHVLLHDCVHPHGEVHGVADSCEAPFSLITLSVTWQTFLTHSMVKR